MSKQKDSEFETYTIPPNFIEGSTLFGGLFKLRNAIEAGVLAIGAGLPVFLLNIPLTTRIIVLCLTALPLALLGLFGVSGECLSSFIFAFFKWLKNRRVVGVVSEKEVPEKPAKKEKPVKKAVREEKKSESKDKEPSMMAEILGVIRKRSAKTKKRKTGQGNRAKGTKTTERKGAATPPAVRTRIFESGGCLSSH